jgi:glycolate oxidase
MSLSPAAATDFRSRFGETGILTGETDLRLYEYDGGVDKGLPEIVVFPRSTADVSAAMELSIKHKLRLVGRGAGTGLSGGSIPRDGGVVLAFARMNKIFEIDCLNERVAVQPGVVNLEVTAAVSESGYFFAPDPSSQKACTIGGNVAENAGGPHTLSYGVTTNHVLGLEAVLPDGSVVEAGGLEDEAGYDLAGLLTGSEGTLAIETQAH